jgi:hypothetical protein
VDGTGVPEAAVDEDGHAGAGEEKIRTATDACNRQRGINAVAETPGVQEAP